MSEITREQWAALCARQQAKADRRWNRRRDWMAFVPGALIGAIIGHLLVVWP